MAEYDGAAGGAVVLTHDLESGAHLVLWVSCRRQGRCRAALPVLVSTYSTVDGLENGTVCSYPPTSVGGPPRTACGSVLTLGRV